MGALYYNQYDEYPSPEITQIDNISDDGLLVFFESNDPDREGFIIERKMDCSDYYEEIILYAADVRTHRDLNLLRNRKYDYRARIYIGDFESPVSGWQSHITGRYNRACLNSPAYEFDVNRAALSTIASNYLLGDAVFGLKDSTNSDVQLFSLAQYGNPFFSMPKSLCVEIDRDGDYFLYNGMKIRSFGIDLAVDEIPMLFCEAVASKESVDTTSTVLLSDQNKFVGYKLMSPRNINIYKDLETPSVNRLRIDVSNNLMPRYNPGGNEIQSIACGKRDIVGEISFVDHNLDNYNDYVEGRIANMVIKGVIDDKTIVICLRSVVYEPFTPVLEANSLIIVDNMSFICLGDIIILVEEEI